MFGRDLIYVVGGVLPLAVSALILPAVTRLMGRSQFGIVSLAVAISSVMYILLTFSLQTAVQREYPRPTGCDRSRGLVAIASLVAVVLSVALASSAHEWAGVLGASGFPWAMELISLWSGGAAIVLVCLGFLRSADRLFAFIVVVLLQSVGAQLVGIGFLLFLRHSAHEYLLGLLIGQTGAAGTAFVLVKPKYWGWRRTGMGRTLMRALSFSVPLVPNQLATYLLWSGDRIVVQRDLGSGAQARYAVAYAIGAMAINVTAQLNYAWVPRIFAIAEDDHRRRVLAEVQRRLLAILAPLILAVSLAVPLLLVIASPKSYTPHTLVLVTLLIVPTALPYSVSLANTRTLLAHGRTGRLAISSGACAVLNITLNVLCVPVMGLVGSALATLLSYACLAWFSGFLVRAEEDRQPHRMRTEVIVWIVVGACIGTVAIPDSLMGETIRLVAFVAATGALFASFVRSRQSVPAFRSALKSSSAS